MVRRPGAGHVGDHDGVQASPDRRVALLLLLVVVTALVALPAVGPTGQVLLAAGAVALGALAGRDLVVRPALAADQRGLRLGRGPLVPWAEVAGLRVVTDRRTPLLEVDLGTTVVVLSRHRLGRAPAEVLAELVRLRP